MVAPSMILWSADQLTFMMCAFTKSPFELNRGRTYGDYAVGVKEGQSNPESAVIFFLMFTNLHLPKSTDSNLGR